jgi:ribonuclease I
MVSALIAKLANTTKLLSLLIPKWLEKANSHLITNGFSLLVKCIQLNEVFICNTFKAHHGVNV